VAAIALVESGCSALELGLPSPTAPENPALTRSHARAARNITTADAFALAAEIARTLPCPIALVSYWPALGDATALAKVLHQAAAAGVSATLVVGLPLLEMPRYSALSAECGLETVLTVDVSMPAQFRQMVYRSTTGALYMKARGGNTASQIRAIRKETMLPLLVGGNLCSAADVAAAGHAGAQAVAVGAAVIERLEKGLPLGPWVRELVGR
jgi:tryptophan synthase alpha subunit